LSVLGDGADIPTNRVALLYRRAANQRWAFRPTSRRQRRRATTAPLSQ
jgi:hypothetical protein